MMPSINPLSLFLAHLGYFLLESRVESQPECKAFIHSTIIDEDLTKFLALDKPEHNNGYQE